jgi:hypothetical protein
VVPAIKEQWKVNEQRRQRFQDFEPDRPALALSPVAFWDVSSSSIIIPSPGSCGHFPGELLHPLGFDAFFVPDGLRVESDTLRVELPDTLRAEVVGFR